LPDSLRLTGLTKRYGQGRPVIADLNHVFEPGTATGLIGPNGSGKTTLLRLLSAVAYPTSGHVHYGDVDIHAQPHAYLRRVGQVYANAELPEHLTAVELLEWILREREEWSDQATSRIEGLLDKVLLDERRHNLIGTYSSGMIQKTQLAAAFVARPDILLLDEPFRGLDTEATAAALELVQQVPRVGGLIIIASHTRALLDQFCDDYMDLTESSQAR
jgi:ABC-2 type transport system ATP-binding protein